MVELDEGKLPNVSYYWTQPEFAWAGFEPIPTIGAVKEFERLVPFMHCTRAERERRMYEAYEAEFDFHYVEGRDAREVWQGICKEVGVEPVPSTIAQC
jgi:hypothetical protein